MTIDEEINKFKEWEKTPEAKADHKNNELTQFAELYKYYRSMNVPKKEAMQYAKWGMENMVLKK